LLAVLFIVTFKGKIMLYIQKIETVNTGGGCMVDLLYLHDGRVIGLNDECAVLYESLDSFFNDGEGIDRPAFTIPRIERMSSAKIADLADTAANEAIRQIQDALGVKTGDFAGLYFSGGDNLKALQSILFDYIKAEISEGGMK
jgi:hypothetical protein